MNRDVNQEMLCFANILDRHSAQHVSKVWHILHATCRYVMLSVDCWDNCNGGAGVT